MQQILCSRKKREGGRVVSLAWAVSGREVKWVWRAGYYIAKGHVGHKVSVPTVFCCVADIFTQNVPFWDGVCCSAPRLHGMHADLNPVSFTCPQLQNYDPERALTDYINRLEALQKRLGSVQSGRAQAPSPAPLSSTGPTATFSEIHNKQFPFYQFSALNKEAFLSSLCKKLI